MTQGTRIALVLLVLLVLGTGAYWLTIGLRTPPATLVDAPPDESVDLEPSAAVEPRRTAADDGRRPIRPTPGAGSPESPVRGSASRRDAAGLRAPLLPSDPAASPRDPSPITPQGPVRPASDRPAERGLNSGAELARSSFLESPALSEVAGKSGDVDVPGFTVVTPVGPEPDPAAPPPNFTPVTPPGIERPVDDSAAPRREPEPRVPTRVVEPAAADGALHVIEEGDTFVTIAEFWFGDRNRWSLIQQANPDVDPTRLRIGQRITLPPRSAGARVAGASTPTPPPTRTAAAPGTVHTVRAGDTLYALARSAYNDGSLWRVIYDANRAAISDPTALRPGVRLTIPAR